METKVCKKCGENKHVSYFTKDSKTKDKLSNNCRKCRNDYYRKKYPVNPSFDNEIWRPVWFPDLGFTHDYLISNFGRVKSVDRIKLHAIGERSYQGKMLKLLTTKDGYKKVIINYNGTYTKLFVHRIVAFAFIPNPHNKPQVNHKNCIVYDNTVDNLEWVTSRENTIYARNLGRLFVARGENHHNHKLTEQDIFEIRRDYVYGKNTRILANKYGVTSELILSIVKRKSWKHVA